MCRSVQYEAIARKVGCAKKMSNSSGVGIKIWMDEEGNTVGYLLCFDGQRGFDCFGDLRDFQNCLVWIVQTEDFARAIKVVKEKRAIILANNAWGDDKKVRKLFGS